jgi:hypothetical protein
MIFKVRNIYVVLILIFFFFEGKGQVLSDTRGVPFDITLTQILRVSIASGGNVEFVFNSIGQYKTGIFNTGFYSTEVKIASSTNWLLEMGAEDAVLLPTDDPVHGALNPETPGATPPGIELNNIGYMIFSMGNNTISSAGGDPTGMNLDADMQPNGLGQFGSPNSLIMSAALGSGNNAGDYNDNAFFILWECGANHGTGINPTNTRTLLEQNIQPDRYVTNVLISVSPL